MTTYALIDEITGEIVKYPAYLPRDVPHVSFRDDPPDDELAQHRVVRVRETLVPEEGSDTVELTPEKQADGFWYRRYQSTPNQGRLDAYKLRAKRQIAAAGRQDWIERVAQLAPRFTTALAEIDAATTGADVKRIIEELR